MRFYLNEENFDPVTGKSFYYQQWVCRTCAIDTWTDFHDIIFDDNQAYRCGHHPCTICGEDTVNLSRGNTIGYKLQDEILKALDEWKALSSKYHGKNLDQKEEYEKWLLKWKTIRKKRILK